VNIEDLFPICADAACALKGQHKHPLPQQLEIINSTAKYTYAQGGYGSAKTLGGCALGILLSLKIPGNRGIVLRESYPKLHDNTQRVFMECLERAGIKWKGRENRDGWYHRIIFPNKSEVHFREGRTVRLGADYGWFLVDEASEVEERLFKNLQARLRLAAARDFLRGVLLSNPPHQNHWLHSIFGDEPRSFAVQQDMGDHIDLSTFQFLRISTRQNPHNPPGYLADLLTGLTQAEIQRLVEGDYGYVPDGPPVYTTFTHHRHVGLPTVQPDIPLVRAWDFGFRHPAITFHQFWRCLKAEIHWSILDAMDGRMIEAKPLAEQVLTYTGQVFKNFPALMIEDCGDRAGAKMSDTGRGPILALSDPPYNLSIMYKDVDVEPGVRMIRDFLRLSMCGCGEERFQIHHKARYVIEGFQGGYHMAREKAGKEAPEVPTKDGFYDDFMDSVRYAAEHHLRLELLGAKMLDTLDKTDPRRMYKDRGRANQWSRTINRLINDARQREGITRG